MIKVNDNSCSEDTPIRITLVAFDDYTDIDLILMWDLLNRNDPQYQDWFEQVWPLMADASMQILTAID